MKKRRRNVQLHFFVTPEEQVLIDQRVEKSRAGNFSNYARKMLLEGEIRWVDASQFQRLQNAGKGHSPLPALLLLIF